MNILKTFAFAFTLFSSAFLMFSLEPMIGKMLLPVVGGSPAGWIVALAFFQTMLLIGYLIAHDLSKFSPAQHAIRFIALLTLGLCFQPIVIKHVDISQTVYPALNVMLMLFVAAAIPFVAISATNSTLQRLYTVSGCKDAKDPYFLYAASNLGSFAGLLLYPFYIEPQLALSSQSIYWEAGYAGLIVLVGYCLYTVWNNDESKVKPESKLSLKKAINSDNFYKLIALSFIPSALLSAVTNYITTDIFSAPLIWVLPLSIYLLTFVVAFSNKFKIPMVWLTKVHPIIVWVTVFATLLSNIKLSLSVYPSIALNLFVFTAIALIFHGKLAESRPKGESVEALSGFYLAMAIGGALGGIINAFIIPFITSNCYEYHIFLALSLALYLKRNDLPQFKLTFFVKFALILIVISGFLQYAEAPKSLIFVMMLYATTLLVFNHKIAFAASSVIIVLMILINNASPDITYSRNFYGIVKVYTTEKTFDKNKYKVVQMQHGTTIHGFQFVDPKLAKEPTTYYARKGPLDNILKLSKPKYVAIAGLGTGTINCYMKPGMKATYFEIDKKVVDLAKSKFTFLSKCGAKMPEIVVGDARMKIAEYQGHKFDLIILDAFSSDTIPAHLITKEALETYLSKLSDNGSIMLHISNRYFDLRAPIQSTAEELNLEAMVMHANATNLSIGGESNIWVLLTKNGKLIQKLQDGENDYGVHNATEKFRPWTDDYTDIMSALKLFK